MSEISPTAEDVLVVLSEEEPRSEPYGRIVLTRLARACDLGSHQDVFLRTLKELEGYGFSRVQGAGAESFAALTDSGREKARDLALVPSSGRVDNFTEGLDDLKKAVLDTVAAQQLRISGGTLVKRSTIRTSVRKIYPEVDIAAATVAIDQLTQAHLHPSSGVETTYQLTLQGLLASAWGINSLGVVDQVLSLLRFLHTADPSVQQYSWRMLRTSAKLPRKALNLAYDTISLTRLGRGLFEHNGDRWWTTPPELDALIEWTSGLAYVQNLVEPAPDPVTAPQSAAAQARPREQSAANGGPTTDAIEAAGARGIGERTREHQQELAFEGGLEGETEYEDTSSPVADSEIRDPFDPNKIRVRQWAPTVYNLMERLAHQELELAPEFQRRAGVWNEQKQSRLVESLLMRIPLPAFYLDELPPRVGDLAERYAVVDGVQRLFVLDRFINRRDLALAGLEFLKLEGKTFDDLPPPLQRRILEAQLSVNVVEAGTPDEAKLNIFKRINTGGVPLTAQEIRHAMSPQVARDWLKKVAESDAFRSAVGVGTAEKMAVRMQDRECAARFAAFLDNGVEDYRKVNTEFDAFVLGAMKRLTSVDRSELERRFDRAMVAAHACLGAYAFRKVGTGGRRGPVSKALFEATAVTLDRRSDAELKTLEVRSARLSELYVRALAQQDVSDAISVGTGDPRRVERRFEALKGILDEALQ